MQVNTRCKREIAIMIIGYLKGRPHIMSFCKLKKTTENISRMNQSESLYENPKFPRSVQNGLCTLNWLFVVASTISLVIGLYLYLKIEAIKILLDVDFNPYIYMIRMSVFLFVIACVGYVAIIRINFCLLCWYLIALMMLLLLYIPIGSAAFAISVDSYKGELGAKESWITLYNYDECPNSKKVMDEVQDLLQCCGLSELGYKDWNNNPQFACDPNNFNTERCGVPLSCCKHSLRRHRKVTNPNPMCGANMLNGTFMSPVQVEEKINTRGCLPVLDAFMQNSCRFLGILSFTTSLAVLLAFILTVMFMQIVGEISEPIRIQNDHVDLNRERNGLEEDPYPRNDHPLFIP